jgi:hypothetical protein
VPEKPGVCFDGCSAVACRPATIGWKSEKFVKDSLDGGASENQVVGFDGFSRHLATGAVVMLSLQINTLPQFEFLSDV